MPSLDNIYDILTLLENEKFSYVLIASSKTKENAKADVFWSGKSKTDREILATVCVQVAEEIIKNKKKGSK